MNRRDFLRLVGLGAVGAAAAATFDPERLLWVPGAKTFFLPSTKPIVVGPFGMAFNVGDLITIEGRYAINPHTLESTEHPQIFVVTDIAESQSRATLGVYPQIEQTWPASSFMPKRKNWEAKPLPWLR